MSLLPFHPNHKPDYVYRHPDASLTARRTPAKDQKHGGAAMSRAVMKQARDALAGLLDDARLVSSGTMATAALTTYMIDAEDAIAALNAALEERRQPKLIGWRTADYTAETDDPKKARNWAFNVGVLPIFEGDTNTRLAAAPETPAPQPLTEQEQPVAEVVEDHFSKQVVGIGKWASLPSGTKLYTAPPAPQPLTVEEIIKLRIDSRGEHVNFARAVWDLAMKRMGVQR